MSKDYSTYFAPSLQDARKRINNDVKNIDFIIEDKYKGLGFNKSFMLKTYGCQGNIADSEKIAGIMNALGYHEVFQESDADVIFFNTCAIRENAENRIYGELGRLKGLKKTNPNLLICLCGCMPQEEVTVDKLRDKYTQVDIVFGTHNIHKIPEYLYEAYKNKERVLEVFSYEGDIVEGIPQQRNHKARAWVDIMYGCDEFCTYCIVPYTRGRERSRSKEHILNEVEDLVNKGYIEVTLLGQNVNAYGKDFENENYTFGDLLEDLAKTGIKRIRYTTSHPRDLDLHTMEVMAKYDNIMPHLHLPVQSGSNKVLKRMNRKYTREIYLEKVNKLKELIPSLALTTDIIVGFPGETEEDFNETLSLVEEAGFEGAYTFIYSPRKGTPAATFIDQVDQETSKRRLLTLNKVINDGFLKGNKRFENTDVEVFVDGVSEKDPNILTGYTKHNKLVNFEGPKEMIGTLQNVHITKAFTWHLRGDLIKKE